MPVAWTMSGAQSPAGFTVSAKVTGGTSCRLVASLSTAMTSPVYSAAVPVDANGYVKLPVIGLQPDLRYFYAVEVDGVLDPWRGRCRTFPSGAASFRFGVSSCSETLSVIPAWDRWRLRDTVTNFHLGDFGYLDPETNDPALFREHYDARMAVLPQQRWHRDTAVSYLMDNHDATAANGDINSPSLPAAYSTFRQVIPHSPLVLPSGAIYRDELIGRVPFILTDQRQRSPNFATDNADKTMTGLDQEDWFKDVLVDHRNAGAPLIFWMSSQVWNSDYPTSWGSYGTQRARLNDWFAANNIPPLIIISGDAHQCSYQKGIAYGSSGRALPEFVSSGIDRKTTVGEGDQWTSPQYVAVDGGGHYSIIDVQDDGDDVSWSVAAWKARSATQPDVNLFVVHSDDPETVRQMQPGYVRTGTGRPARAVKINDGSTWVQRPVYYPTVLT